jgi:hypothetical protein
MLTTRSSGCKDLDGIPVGRGRAGREGGRQKARSSRAPAQARSKKVKVTRAQGRVAVSPGQVQSRRTVVGMRPGRERRCRRSARGLPRPRTDVSRDFATAPLRTHGCRPPSWCPPHFRHRFRGRARRRPGRGTTDFVRNGTRPRGNTTDLHFLAPSRRGSTTIFHFPARSRRGNAAEGGSSAARRTTIPAFGPGAVLPGGTALGLKPFFPRLALTRSRRIT